MEVAEETPEESNDQWQGERAEYQNEEEWNLPTSFRRGGNNNVTDPSSRLEGRVDDAIFAECFQATEDLHNIASQSNELASAATDHIEVLLLEDLERAADESSSTDDPSSFRLGTSESSVNMQMASEPSPRGAVMAFCTHVAKRCGVAQFCSFLSACTLECSRVVFVMPWLIWIAMNQDSLEQRTPRPLPSEIAAQMQPARACFC